MDMCQNILLPRFKGEQPGSIYYLSLANIYGLGIHDTSNNICYFNNYTEFERKKEMNNIVSWLLRWINAMGCYYKSYGKNNKMTKIAIIVDNCGGQNKNNVMIYFINMINEGGLYVTANLYFYIKGNTKNGRDHAFDRLKVLYRKQNLFPF